MGLREFKTNKKQTNKKVKTEIKLKQGHRGKPFAVSEYKLVEVFNLIFKMCKLKFRGLDCSCYEIL